MMSKRDTIAAIRVLNTTVSDGFLDSFSYRQLRAYLTRLQGSAQTKREIDGEPVAVAHPSLAAVSRRASA